MCILFFLNIVFSINATQENEILDYFNNYITIKSYFSCNFVVALKNLLFNAFLLSKMIKDCVIDCDILSF